MTSRVVPKFASEAEEAQWWYDNREELSQDWASPDVRFGPGSAARLRDRLAAARAEQDQAKQEQAEPGSFQPASLKRAS